MQQQDRFLIAMIGSFIVIAVLLLILQGFSLSFLELFSSKKTETEEIFLQETDEVLEENSTSLASNMLVEEKNSQKNNNYQQIRQEVSQALERIEQQRQTWQEQTDFSMSNSEGITEQKNEVLDKATQEQIAKIEENKAWENNQEENYRQYTGLSSYQVFLKNRKIIQESPPLYKCQNAGQIRVFIQVSQQGFVQKAQIYREKRSENKEEIDHCLQEAALESAYKTLFNPDFSAEDPQAGEIIFIFSKQK